MKSEFQVWRDELHPPVKPTLSERVARWFERPNPEPTREMFAWGDLDNLMPIEGDTDV